MLSFDTVVMNADRRERGDLNLYELQARAEFREMRPSIRSKREFLFDMRSKSEGYPVNVEYSHAGHEYISFCMRSYDLSANLERASQTRG